MFKPAGRHVQMGCRMYSLKVVCTCSSGRLLDYQTQTCIPWVDKARPSASSGTYSLQLLPPGMHK